MGDLNNIGNGVEVLDTTKASAASVDNLTKTLGLVDLSNKIKQAPIDLATKQAGYVDLLNKLQQAPAELQNKQLEAIIKSHEVANFATADALQQATLAAKVGEEQRAQANFMFNGVKSALDLYNVNPELGQLALQKVFPQALSAQNKDGTFAAAIPNGQGGLTAIQFDPRNVGDAKQKTELEDKYRQSWEQNAQGYSLVHEFHRNLTQLLPQATGAADTGVFFSFMKLMDRNTRVGEGQVATAENAPGIPSGIRNLYNRALTEDAPVLGPPGSAARRMFAKAADTLYNNARETALQQAGNWYHLAQVSHIRPEAVVTPMGDISWKDFTQQPAQQQQGAGRSANSAKAPQNLLDAARTSDGTTPNAAPTPNSSAPADPEAQLNQVLQQIYQR